MTTFHDLSVLTVATFHDLSVLTVTTFHDLSVLTVALRSGVGPGAVGPAVDVDRAHQIIAWVTTEHQHRSIVRPAACSRVHFSIGWIILYATLLS